MFKNEYNGRDGNGYEPLKTPGDFKERAVFGSKRPATTEYLSSGQRNSSSMENMSVITFLGFMFCALCIGIGIGCALHA